MDPADSASNLTKREYFAAAALSGLLSDPTAVPRVDAIAFAVIAADALIDALANPPQVAP